MFKTKMSPGKMRKAFLKRFKITRRGKLLRRISGVSHFRVKKDKDLIRNKRRLDEGDEMFLKYAYY